MNNSPSNQTTGVVTVSIMSNGAAIADDIELISVSIDKAINRVPTATLVFVDGDMPTQDFPLSNANTFKPGAEIEVKAGYHSKEESLFKGLIIRHAIKAHPGGSNLLVECRDPAVAMTIGRKNANFVDSKDSDVISELISGYSGLSASVDATSVQHPELVQYDCTDWDFMLMRSEPNGLIVLVDAGELIVQPPDTSAEAVLEVAYGEDLIDFEAAIDARTQLEEVVAVSWDQSEQAAIEQMASPGSSLMPGNLASADLSGIAGPSSYRLQTAAPMDTEFLTSWAQSRQLKSELARIRGRMRFQGSAAALPGTVMTVSGVGERFNGDVFVSSVRHELSGGNWLSEVEFGLSDSSFAARSDIVSPAASGLVPAVEGLQIGVVRKLVEDPSSSYRILVALPVLQAENEGVWARLASTYASEGVGSFFLPEVGDEVLLGYLNNDPAHPVIIGSLYSSRRTPPREPDESNSIKALVTRSELTIEFDEEKKSIAVSTPANNRIVISDDEGSILIQDQNDNQVELNSDGILLSSPKDIQIKASGNIVLEADGEIGIGAQSDVSVAGLNINNKATSGFSAEGSASSELSSSGQTSVKGSLVMIN